MTPRYDFVITEEQEKILAAKIPAGHSALHAHWEYYVRLMQGT